MSTKHCDHWWEPETEWHRAWKDQFPSDWQEIGRRDENGDLHIADVLAPQGLVLEFQHSAIKREEVEIRTKFHGKICWIVDGLRLENSLAQFAKALNEGIPVGSRGAIVYRLYYSDSRLLRTWSGLAAPVVFDFGGDTVWVLATSLDSTALVYPFERQLLIERCKLGNLPPKVQIEPPRMQYFQRRLRYRTSYRRQRGSGWRK